MTLLQHVDGDVASTGASYLELAQFIMRQGSNVAEYFWIKPHRADKIINEVVASVKNWQKEANAIGISALEQERMSRAFRIVKKL